VSVTLVTLLSFKLNILLGGATPGHLAGRLLLIRINRLDW
jgi:hypothetical protein